jgi:hypothetical protein
MTFLKFAEAKKLMRKIAKDFELKNEDDWKNFTNSKDFFQFSTLIPKKPWNYYSKANVIKRMEKETKN